MQRNNQIDKNASAYLSSLTAGARTNSLIVFIFTVINSLMIFINGPYFLFSAIVPFYSEAYAYAFFAEFKESGDKAASVAAIIFLIVGIVLAVPYLLSFLFSKKHPIGWTVFTLIWFSLDCIGLVLISISDIASFIFDYVFHVWMIIILIRGLRGAVGLKKMQKGKASAPAEDVFFENSQSEFFEEITEEKDETKNFPNE